MVTAITTITITTTMSSWGSRGGLTGAAGRRRQRRQGTSGRAAQPASQCDRVHAGRPSDLTRSAQGLDRSAERDLLDAGIAATGA